MTIKLFRPNLGVAGITAACEQCLNCSSTPLNTAHTQHDDNRGLVASRHIYIYIYIFARLTTELRLFSVLCKDMHISCRVSV